LNILKADLFGDIVFKPYCFAKNYPQWIYRRRDQGASNYTENLDWLYRWRFGFMNVTITWGTRGYLSCLESHLFEQFLDGHWQGHPFHTAAYLSFL